MAEHEPSIGLSSDWYTPPEIFDTLGLVFDLDPCSPGPEHWVPARRVYTKADDGLTQPWEGLVFMNPPFEGRNGHVPWLRCAKVCSCLRLESQPRGSAGPAASRLRPEYGFPESRSPPRLAIPVAL